MLRRIADRIADRFDDLLAAEVGDTGKPEAQARALDVARAIANFRSFADILANQGSTSFLTDTADGGQALNYAVSKPLGVVAIVVPWNLPLLLLTWKVAPALACGNTVVVKPSEETPSSATVLAEVIAEAGLPDGVFNLVHGFGPGSAGEFLTTHAGVDGVTFTGESRTGAAIMAAVAPTVKPVSFELGGKNAALVFADADLDARGGRRGPVVVRQHRPGLPVHRAGLRASGPSTPSSSTGWPRRPVALRLGGPDDPDHHHRPADLAWSTGRRCCRTTTSPGRTGEIVTGGDIPDLGERFADGAWIEPTIVTGRRPTLAADAGGGLRADLRGRPRSTPRRRRSRWPTTAATGWPPPPGPPICRRGHRVAAADAGRHLLGEHLVPAGPALALRRPGLLRHRP